MWDFVSLKCTNWLVKCNLCASDAVLALERRFARANAHALTNTYTKSRPQNESGLKLPCAMPASVSTSLQLSS